MAGANEVLGLTMQMFVLEPRDTAALRWSKWIDRFQNYIEATCIEGAKRQKAILLHLIGEDLYNIYKTLTIPNPGDGETEFSIAIKVLTEHFSPKRNREFELFQFREAYQRAEEDLDGYYARLVQLAKNCDFKPEDMESEIKSQIMQKCKMTKLRDEGLCKPNLTLSDILKIGRTQECASRQSKITQSKLQSEDKSAIQSQSTEQVHKMGARPKQRNSRQNQNMKRGHKCPEKPGSNVNHSKGKVCFACGGKWPHPRDKKCPVIGRKCRSCGQQNHFSSQCGNFKKVNMLDTDKEVVGDYGEEYEEMLHISQSPRATSHKAYLVLVKINGVSTNMELDTGASLSIMSLEAYQRLCHPKVKPKLEKSDISLRTYTGELIIPEGQVTVDVEYLDQKKCLNLTILPRCGPALLGRDWLQHLRLDWKSLNKGDSVHRIQGTKQESEDISELDRILHPYQDLFKPELGELKGTTVKINVDDKVIPQFHKARPIPFLMKDKVTKELDRLENQGVIKPVQFADWAAPIVAYR